MEGWIEIKRTNKKSKNTNYEQEVEKDSSEPCFILSDFKFCKY
jgi:hypothetical protein